MLELTYTGRFKKDLKTCQSRGCNMMLFQQVVDTLRIPDRLPPNNADHSLTGNYSGYRECHIAPDWLMIYKQTADELILYRTGTHSDLFGK